MSQEDDACMILCSAIEGRKHHSHPTSKRFHLPILPRRCDGGTVLEKEDWWRLFRCINLPTHRRSRGVTEGYDRGSILIIISLPSRVSHSQTTGSCASASHRLPFRLLPTYPVKKRDMQRDESTRVRRRAQKPPHYRSESASLH